MDTDRKRENEKKKEYLWKYRDTVNRIKRIDEELKEVREIKTSISQMLNDGMPHCHRRGDMSGYAAKFDTLERELIEERYSRIMIYLDISKRINRIKKESERDVLFYRYIRRMEWDKIAERMSYSERQVFRIHGMALAHFEITKDDKEDVSECQ